MISRRSVLAAGVLAPLGGAVAETRYPAHTVTVVNPFAAGGQSEPVGRIVNTHFQSVLGQPFVMENRVGAGSTIGLPAQSWLAISSWERKTRWRSTPSSLRPARRAVPSFAGVRAMRR